MLYDNYSLKYLLIGSLTLITLVLIIGLLEYFHASRTEEKSNVLYSYTVGGASRSGVIVQAICNRKSNKCLCFNESTMEQFPCPE